MLSSRNPGSATVRAAVEGNPGGFAGPWSAHLPIVSTVSPAVSSVSPTSCTLRMAHASTSRWSLDYASTPSKTTVISPPGYTPATKVRSPSPPSFPRASRVTPTHQRARNFQASTKSATALIKPVDLSGLRQQKAWDMALAPAKNVPMQAFMMYMTGGGVQIFSVMSVWSCLKGAVSGILSVEKAFAPFISTTPSATPSPTAASFTLQKATFIACQIGLLAVGLWKCNQMGLLPSHDSDWLAFKEMPVWEEATGISEGLWEGIY